MSIDQQRTRTESGREPPGRDGGGRRVAVILGGLIAASAVAAGGVVLATADRDSGVILQTPSAAPSALAPASLTPAPPLTVEEQILAQYRQFSETLDGLANVPAAERPTVWRKVASEPQYTSSLEEMAALDAAGETLYGRTKIKPRVTSIDQGTAFVQDCQDGSQAGSLRQSDGEKLTVGPPSQLAVTRMTSSPDGVWRVAEVVYPPPPASC